MTQAQTTMLNLRPIALTDTGWAKITLQRPDGTIEAQWLVPGNLILAGLVEMFTIYKVNTVFVEDIMPAGRTISDMMAASEGKAFAPLDLSVNGEVTVSFKNGDTGAPDYGHGASMLDAIADLARSHGFESRMATLGRVTIHEWFEDFKYGMERRSAEILHAELSELTGDPNGAW